MTDTDKATVAQIDLDTPASPAVLAGILGISVPMIYQGRQDGKLPPESNASYRNCIQQYVQWHKKRSNTKASNMAEKKMLQEIRNGIAKEEKQWLDIRAQRGMLIDKEELKNVVEPVFHLVRSGLVNLSREYPDLQEKIDGILRSWSVLGTATKIKAETDSNQYVQNMLELDVDDSLDQGEPVE